MGELHLENKIYWVRGNREPLVVPLEQEIVPQEGEVYTEPYYPVEGSVVTASFIGRFKRYSYTPRVEGNLLFFDDNGTLSTGAYGLEITIVEPDGSRRRSYWENQVVVTESNATVLQEWDEFKSLDVRARAAVFFFAKGDPFTYEDFTTEQIEDLKKPAYDAAAEVGELERRIEDAETLRVQAEERRVDAEAQREHNETIRQQAEQQRQQDYTNAEAQRTQSYQTAERNRNEAFALSEQSRDAQVAEAVRLAGNATTAAINAALNANDKATLASEKAEYAAGKGDYAKEQGDEAKRIMDSSKGSFESLDARLNAMSAETQALDEAKLDKVTEEQFNEIFN